MKALPSTIERPLSRRTQIDGYPDSKRGLEAGFTVDLRESEKDIKFEKKIKPEPSSFFFRQAFTSGLR